MFGLEVHGYSVPVATISLPRGQENTIQYVPFYTSPFGTSGRTNSRTITSILDAIRRQLLSGGVSINLISPLRLSLETSSAKLTQMVAIFRACHTTLVTPTITTIRDVYYRDVELFKSQRTVVSILDQICRVMDVPLSKLAVVASQKGLMAGNALINTADGTIELGWQPQLIPDHVIGVSGIDLVVILEKDAIFTQFVHYVLERPLPILVVTGKGFPDKLTVKLCAAAAAPQVVYVDLDVYGMHIARCYPKAWYGGVELLAYHNGWLETTNHERRMAASLMNSTQSQLVKTELQRGWILNKKAELNVVDGGNAVAYVYRLVCSQLARLI